MSEIIAYISAFAAAFIAAYLFGRKSERNNTEKKRVKNLEKANEIHKEHSKMDDDDIRDRARSRVRDKQ